MYWITKFIIQAFHLKPHAKLLVICPKSLKLQWASEIKRALGIDSLLINGLKHLSVLSSSNIHIATYQFFARHANEFAKFDYDLVIMDEIQFIRNEESKVWKAAKKIKTEFFFGLSGTVIENKLDDLYAIMDVIAPDFLGPKWKFSTEYQELISVTRKVLIFVGVRNIDKLREKIKTKVFGYNKLTLPAITHTYKNVAMTKQQQTVHDDYYGMAQRLLAKSMTSGLNYGEKMLLQSLLLKSRQSANTIELIDKNPSPNSPKITSIITDLASYSNTNRKVVVFSQWTEFLDILARELGKLNIKFVYYTGRETERQRLKSVETFSNDPAVTVFLASDAGGVGLDGLQKAASVVIHTELPWNPARLDQRTGRVYRLGQTQPVEAVYYYAKNSIEEKILDVLQGKRDIRSFALKPMNE
jgi:SNF2 family DNA or RNA helicase